MLSSYGKYVLFRNLMEWEADRRPPEYASLTQLWKDRKEILALIGNKCRQCGYIQIDFPVQRICSWCQAKDDFEPVRLSDKKGSVFTFSMDERAKVIKDKIAALPQSSNTISSRMRSYISDLINKILADLD